MKSEDLDKILSELSLESERKRTLALSKVNAEIDAINREAVAYFDGAYDAIKRVRNLVGMEQ